MFYFDEILGKKVLKSDKIKVPHFFTTREFILKTKEENSEFQFENREIIKELYNLKEIITPSQRHTSNVKIAQIGGNFIDTDGLILKNPDIGIFLNFADCTPLIFYDKKKNIAAISHAGWRGTVQKISKITVSKMQSDPNDLICLIGPSICYNCFETNEDIKNQLISTVLHPENLYKKGDNDKWFVDLKGINKMQLNEFGVKNIDIAPYCTVCNNNYFYSYRKENKTTNRMSAFICLK